MFHSLCKSLFQSSKRIINGENSKPLLILCSHFRSFSSSIVQTSGSSSSFVVSYLINSCGLTEKQAFSTSKNLNFKTTSNPDTVLALFEDYGFNKSHISKIITNRPLTLLSDAQKTLKPKLDYFNSKEVSRVEVAKVLSSNPEILKRSLEKHIIPFFDFIKNIVGTDQHTFLVFGRTRYHVSALYESLIMLNIQVLRDEGVPQSNIVKFLIDQPMALMIDTVKFKDTVQEIKGMGFDPCKCGFLTGIRVVNGLTKSTWETKLDVYKKWGWSDDQIRNAFKTYPICMMYSEKKISETMDYLVNQMGYDASSIHPLTFGFSLEKRIIPRCSVHQILISKGLNEDKVGLYWLLLMNEKSFLEKCVIKYEKEAPELLKICDRASIRRVLEDSQSEELILAAEQVIQT